MCYLFKPSENQNAPNAFRPLLDTQTFARHREGKRRKGSKEKRNWQKTVNNCPFPQTTKKEVTEKWTYYLNFRWETLTVMAKKAL